MPTQPRQTRRAAPRWSGCLITNDDGPVPMLRVTTQLARELFGSDVMVAVPSVRRVSVSAGATPVGTPIVIERDDNFGVWLIDGYPADCVQFALDRDAPSRFVISGINPGYNLGGAVLQSGTVGAVLAATRYGSSGIAISTHHQVRPSWSATWATAVAALLRTCIRLVEHHANGPVALNINLPAPTRQANIPGVLLPVSRVEFDRWADPIHEGRGRRVQRVWGHTRPDPLIPDVSALATGCAVINLLPSPWTGETAELRSKLLEAFPPPGSERRE